MARVNDTETTDTKPAKKVSAKEQQHRELVRELSIIFSDISLDEVNTLATMNQIADLRERGTALQYFWAARKLNK
jgi:hypothetical protein